MLQFTLKVVDIKQETNDTVTIFFKQPGLKKVKYLAGQYLTLVFNINNRQYLRPYSFSSAPGVDLTLNITVKRVPGGIVSNHIVDCVKIGDIIEVKEPLGEFTLESSKISGNNHLIFWGAGSGITPLFSLIKYALNNNLTKHTTLVYGNRNQESSIFHHQINDLQKKYHESFSVRHFHTQFVADDEILKVTQGRIDVKTVIDSIKQGENIHDTYHFICGPQGLKETVESVLKEENVPQSHIIYESFELVLNPKDFEGILTQTVNIKKGTENYNVEVIKGKTILEAALDAVVDLSYSCQTGTCLLCKAKLLSGKLKVISSAENAPTLDENEYLLCCSLPLTCGIEVLVS